MKHIYLALVAIFLVFIAKAQTVATFEDLKLAPETFWNGSDGSGSFKSGEFTFYNSFDAQWNSWSGFAYSDMTDVTTSGYQNQYSAITGIGCLGSANYAVCYPVPTAEIELSASGKTNGFYVTNSTYAYLSMKNGDAFAKKFGGLSGNDPDYFKLIIEALDPAGQPVDTVNFYLADFRFADNTQDYILNKWTWVDLSKLKEAKKLRFSLVSSDNSFGYMNTPGYFCIDNLNQQFPTATPETHQAQARIYPNPFTDRLTISGITDQAHLTVSTISGKIVAEYFNVSNNQSITGLNNLISGIYFVKTDNGKTQTTTKLIKK